ISGKPLPDPGAAARRAREEREQLEWLAQISPKHAAELRELESAEADVRRNPGSLEWAAKNSRDAENEIEKLFYEEAVAKRAQERWERIYEASAVEEAWDPSKHPRLGGPPNAGWFSATSGSADQDTRTGSTAKIQGAVEAPKKSKSPVTADASKVAGS